MAFVHEHEYLADGRARLRFKVLDEGVEVVDPFPAELVDQGTQEPRPRLHQLRQEVPAARAPADGFAGSGEDPLDLSVEFVAVGDDHDPGLGQVLQDPSRQQDHDEALPAALRMPEDPPQPPADVLLRGPDAEVLVHPRRFLGPAVEQDEVVDQLEEPILATKLEQVLVELEPAVVRFVGIHLGRDSIPQEAVDRLVVPVETASVVIGLGP